MTSKLDNLVLYCAVCNADREFVREIRRETHDIRNIQVTADVPVCVCTHCGDTRPDPDPALDPMIPLYRAYRAQAGLLQPDEIKAIREKYNLSREAFAAVLGMSAASLYRYEDGGLQDQLHDSMIFACGDPAIMRSLVARHPDRLTKLQQERFEAAVRELMAAAGPATRSAAGAKG